jgi:hypothetical protein
MKEPNLVVKIAVVASSILLVGGCVSYHAGAFNSLLASKDNVADPGNGDTSPGPQVKSEQKPASAQTPITIMPSTKSPNPRDVISGLIPAGETTSPPQSSKPSDLFAK